MTDSSLVYTTNFEVGTNGPQNFIDKLKDVFSYAGTHYWKLDDSPDGTDINVNQPLYALLKAKPQSWSSGQAPADFGLEDPNDQQILIEATAGTNQMVYVTYFPKGGVTNVGGLAPYNTLFTPGIVPILNSGRRKALHSDGTNTYNYGLNSGGAPPNSFFSGQFWIAEHRDINVSHPFSSLTLMLNTGEVLPAGFSTAPTTGNFGQAWGAGFHAGRILSPSNWNDPSSASLNSASPDANHASPGSPLITGDGVLSGVPDMWSYHQNSLYYNYWLQNGSIRAGNDWQSSIWDYANGYAIQPPEAILSDANSLQRLAPLECKLNNGRFIGYTKYLRFYKNTFSLTPTIIPAKHSSDQAWVGWRNFLYSYTGTGNFGGSRLCLLWNKNYTIVP